MEGLMLKLKLQYFGHLMQRADTLEKTLMLGETEGRAGSALWSQHLAQGSEARRWLVDAR